MKHPGGTVRWLGDPVSDCKENQSNRDQCAAFAASVGPATGTWPLMPFYRDQCLSYLCNTGTMPTSTSNLPAPPPLYEMYPWGVWAGETVALQNELNKKLLASGLCALDPDGKVGASTCGAAKKYGVNIPSCAGHSAPPPQPCSATPKKEEPAIPVPVSASTPAADKGLPWGWIIGGAAVVGLAWLASRSVGTAVGAPGMRDS